MSLRSTLPRTVAGGTRRDATTSTSSPAIRSTDAVAGPKGTWIRLNAASDINRIGRTALPVRRSNARHDSRERNSRFARRSCRCLARRPLTASRGLRSRPTTQQTRSARETSKPVSRKRRRTVDDYPVSDANAVKAVRCGRRGE